MNTLQNFNLQIALACQAQDDDSDKYFVTCYAKITEHRYDVVWEKEIPFEEYRELTITGLPIVEVI